MAWSVDDQQSWNIHWYFEEGLALFHLFDKFFRREESCTYLLGDTASLALLNVGVTDLVEQSGFACVDVTKNAADWASELSLLAGEIGAIVTPFAGLLLFLFLFSLFHHMSDFLLSWLLGFLLLVFLSCSLVGLF